MTLSSAMKRAVVAFRRQAHETRELLRHGNQRRHRLAVALARQTQRQRETEIGNERKRMRRIDRQRRQNREHLLAEFHVEPGAIGVGQFVGAQDRDAGIAKLGAQRRPHLLLIADQPAGHLLHLADLLFRREPVIADR